MSTPPGDPPDGDDDGDPKEAPPPKPPRSEIGKAPRRPQLMRARIREVDQLLRSCMTHGTIERICAKNWDITPRQVRNYIAAVFRHWEREAESTRPHVRELRRAQLEGVLERCLTTVDPDHIEGVDPETGKPIYMLKPDLRTATIALHRLCMIDGVYEPTRVEVTNADGRPKVEAMKSMDRESELMALLERYKAQKEAAAERRNKAH